MKTDDATASFNLGVDYARGGHLVEAISAYREALSARPDFAEAWYNLAHVHGDRGQFASAIGFLREAVRLRPDYEKAWFNLGVASEILGDREEVQRVHRHLSALAPDVAARFLEAVVPEE